MYGNGYRLLKIKEILMKKSDEEKGLSIADVLAELHRKMPGMTYDQRTIKNDFKILNQAGFKINSYQGKYGKLFYYHYDRLFEIYQIRLLVDALLSARFITTKEKEYLIEKVTQLTSEEKAKTLPRATFFNQTANKDNEYIRENIHYIHEAIANQKVLYYKYGRYNMAKEFEFRREGMTYTVEPYALIWQNDYYYLIGRFQLTGEIRHYRLDRMRHVQLSEEKYRRDQDFDLQTYVDQTFHMFAGENVRVRIQFDASLINVILDRFGHDVSIQQVSEDAFILSAQVKLSDGFIHWLLARGDRAKVLSPDHLVKQMKERIAQMSKVYSP